MSATHNEHPKESQKPGAMSGMLLLIPIIILGLVILKFLIGTTGRDGKDDREERKNLTEQINTPGEKIKIVYFGPEYNEPTNIPGGYTYYFEDADQPYCYKNKNSEGNCADEGEDASGELGDGPANKKLWFKSQNGKNGSLKIVLTQKICY